MKRDCCCSVTTVMSDSVQPHRRQPTRLPCPWDSPGKSTGVGCHFLLQGMKVKSESELAQSYPTLSDRIDCSQSGSSIHRIFQASILEWGAIASSMKRNYQTLTVLEGKEITKPSLAFLLHIRKKGTYVKSTAQSHGITNRLET